MIFQLNAALVILMMCKTWRECGRTVRPLPPGHLGVGVIVSWMAEYKSSEN